MRGGNGDAVLAQTPAKSIAHCARLFIGNQTAGDARLVADDNQQKSSRLQLLQRGDSVGKEFDIFGPANITAIDNQRAVAIEEKCLVLGVQRSYSAFTQPLFSIASRICAGVLPCLVICSAKMASFWQTPQWAACSLV